MRYFDSSLGKIYYKTIGQQGKALLLIHGNIYDSSIFDSLVDKLKNDYRLYIPDLPGHGKSDRLDEFPPDYYLKLAKIFLKWLKEENLKEVNIIGIRGGSIIAINMASMNPRMINKVIADSFPGKKISNGNLDLMIEETRKQLKKIFPRFYFRSLHGKHWRKIIENDLHMMESMKYNDHRVVVPGIKKISSDILLIGCAGDDLVPRLGPIYKKLQEKFPHFKTILFECGKHPAIKSNKKKFIEESQAFLNNHN